MKVKKTNGWYSSNIWIPFLSRLSWQASPLIMSFFPAMQKKQFWKINFVLFSILNWRWKTPAKETILENKYILSCFFLFSILNLRWNTTQANHICLKSFVQSFGAKWKIYQSNEVKVPNYQIDICRFVLILFSFLIKQITSNLNRF